MRLLPALLIACNLTGPVVLGQEQGRPARRAMERALQGWDTATGQDMASHVADVREIDLPKPISTLPASGTSPDARGNEEKQPAAPAGRLASVFVSDDLLGAILTSHLSGPLLQNINLDFDADRQEVQATGQLRLPADGLQDLNMDPKSVPDLRFKLSMQFKTTAEGYIAVIFPLEETYFYPVGSKQPERDRVIVPVQLLDVILNAARGYFSVLSGDLSGYDKRAAALQRSIALLDRTIAKVNDPDEKAALVDQRAQLALKLQAIPIEKRQAEREARKLGGALTFVGKNERLDDALAADRNAIVIKMRLDQFVPYLKGIRLGGIRIVKDTKDGEGENFLAVDLVAEAQP